MISHEEEAEELLTGPHGVGISSWCLGLRFGERRSEPRNGWSDDWRPNKGLQKREKEKKNSNKSQNHAMLSASTLAKLI